MSKKYKIVYCTPSLYMAGGIERVLVIKANYFADTLGYDVYIIITDGNGKQPFYSLSPKVHIIQLNINFEKLWHMGFIKKSFIYLYKQRLYKRKLSKILYQLKPDITISLLRREINFITNIKDGSKKIGELHVNRNNYRNFEEGDSNIVKRIFSRYWMWSLTKHLKKLDRFVVLTNEDKNNWPEINRIFVISNPISLVPSEYSNLKDRRVVAVGRYVYQKGFDLLLKSWKKVQTNHPEWHLYIYGAGDRSKYYNLASDLGILDSCHLEGAVADINSEYLSSSILAFPSRFEGFGMVIIEAMSCGVPCVSFECPCGPKDIIQNGVNGFLVKNYDIDAFSEKLELLMKDEELRNEMGNNALESIKKYSIENIGKQWQTLFDGLYYDNHE